MPSTWLKRFDRLWGKARPWLTPLWIARASVASVVLGGILFTVPDAVHDILRALAQDLTTEGKWVGPHWHRLIAFFPVLWRKWDKPTMPQMVCHAADY